MSDQIVTCPHCSKDVHLSHVATVPDSQRVTMTITSESKYLEAQLLGETIECTAKCLKEIAKSLGQKVAVFVGGIALKDSEISVEFLVVTGVEP